VTGETGEGRREEGRGERGKEERVYRWAKEDLRPFCVVWVRVDGMGRVTGRK
jgi:hypothetical protein